MTPELNWSLIAANMNYEMKKIKVASLSHLELSSEVFKPDESVTRPTCCVTTVLSDKRGA